MTQTEIARYCNCDRSYISRINSHERDSHTNDSQSVHGKPSTADRLRDLYRTMPSLTQQQAAELLGVSGGSKCGGSWRQASLGTHSPSRTVH
jgi:hypothetical protein